MRLPREDLDRFVRGYFTDREKYLHVLEEAASPLYILEPRILTRRAEQFRRAFTEQFPAVRFYFAVKSNNHPTVTGTVLAAGFGLDVSSGQELAAALELGAGDILFTGPGKTVGELALAVENAGRVTILMDSFQELQTVENIAAARGGALRAGVRLNTNPTGLWRKFGIPLRDLRGFFEEAEKCPHVRLRGLQFHTSWNLSPRAQTDFLGLLGGELATWPAASLEKIEFLDIGGGYWPPPGEWLRAVAATGGVPEEGDTDFPSPLSLVHDHHPAAPIEEFAAELRAAVDRHLPFLLPGSIYCEPGRWICNDAMHLLMTVVDRKAPDLVITDSGIHAVGWERFETDYFPVLNLTRPARTEKPCLICGSLCTPHDLFGFSYFGEDIRSGDVLLIPCQGAYTYSLKQEFIKPVPKVATIFA